MKIIDVAVVGLLVTVAMSCGGGSSSNSASNSPQQATLQSGAWEFVFTSTNNDPSSANYAAPILIEANLAQNGTQVSSSQANSAIYNPNSTPSTIGPGCEQSCDILVSGTISGSSVSFTVSGSICGDCNTPITATGTVSTNSLSGPWTSGSGNNAESGTFTASPVSPLSGMYSGSLTDFLANPSDTVTANLIAGNSDTLTVTSGGTVYSFGGSSLGNIITLSGTASGQSVSWWGYHDANGTYSGKAKSVWLVGSSSCGNGCFQGEGEGFLTAD